MTNNITPEQRLEILKNAGAQETPRPGKDPLLGIRPLICPKDELMTMGDATFTKYAEAIQERYNELTAGLKDMLQGLSESTQELIVLAERAASAPYATPVLQHGMEKAVGHLRDAKSNFDGLMVKDI